MGEQAKLTRAAYRRLLLDDAGNWREDARLVLADLELVCYAIRSTIPGGPGPIDPMRVAHNEGCRSVFHHIKRMALLGDED